MEHETSATTERESQTVQDETAPLAASPAPVQTVQRSRLFSTRNLTVTAVLTAISFLLYMFVKFPLPFFPPFLDIQFSDMPALIGGFMMGPWWGCVIIVLKCLLKFPFSGTMYVGEVADIFVGIAFVLPSALLYRRFHTKKGAVAALAVGTGCATAMALLTNAVLLIPMYSKLFGWDMLIKSMASLFPGISQTNFYLYYLPLSILPFNILRCIVCSLITFLVYKGLQRLIDTMFAPRKKKAVQSQPPTDNKHTST